ncbi:MAG: ATP synthase F1 subunit epsilon [Ignavibacteriales bacterium]|nr:ATP synthase F1 subunit epsilon [Ignavibacteriales bacterium]
MKIMNLEIITPEKLVYKSQVISISIPGTIGSFQVLFDHAPIISSFEIGRIVLVDRNNLKVEFITSGGIIKVEKNNIIVLAETIEKPEEIDIKLAEEALREAKKKLSILEREDVDVDRAEIALKKAINRLKHSRKPI